MAIDQVQFLEELVRIPSVSAFGERGVVRQNYRKAADTVARYAAEAGLEVKVEDLLGGEIPTVLVSLPEKASGKPSVAFVTHYDVVPARAPWLVEGREVDPFEPLVIGGKVYGRGAADDKSAIVATICGLADIGSARELRYNPVVVVTGDEEVGGTGVRALLDKGYRWDRVIIVDSGSEYVSIGASGVIAGWIKVTGRSGHAGYPHQARNAAEELFELLSELKSFKVKRASKLSRLPAPPGSPVSRVWGRFSLTILKLPPSEPEKHNRIPGEAWAGFDMRLLPEESVEEGLRELFEAFSSAIATSRVQAVLEVVAAQRGWYAKNEEFVSEVLAAARQAYRDAGLEGDVGLAGELGGNDGTYFDAKGMDVVAFGTIRSGTNIHSEGEFVYVKDIEMYRYFMRRLLSG
ncbi:MAG: M20/M25/M40 family metallo-hydrolase [Thermofilum sp.]